MNENSKFELFLYFTSWNFIFRIEFIYILTVRWSNNDRNRIKGIEKESRIDGASVEMAGADSASVIPLFFLCRCSSFFERDKTNRHVTEYTEELCIYDCIENASIYFSNSPVFVRLTFRRFFIGQTSREHRSWFFWTTRFDYPILYPNFFESLNQLLQENENSFSPLLSFIFLRDPISKHYFEMFLFYIKVTKIMVIFGFKLI